MKHKTAELTGELLDRAVIKAGRVLSYEGDKPPPWSRDPRLASIILGEGNFVLKPWTLEGGARVFFAYFAHIDPMRRYYDEYDTGSRGSTWMEAVCRAEVASKLGDEVDL